MLQDKEISKNWLRVDPIETPILIDRPQHQPERFSQYTELKDEKDKVIGFQVGEQQYFFDDQEGWKDENGCYYDKEGQPAGWFVLHPGDKYKDHFYDQDGIYVMTDIETSDHDQENDDEVKQQGDEQQSEDVKQSEKNDIEEYEAS